jgi:hypothetical protein
VLGTVDVNESVRFIDIAPDGDFAAVSDRDNIALNNAWFSLFRCVSPFSPIIWIIRPGCTPMKRKISYRCVTVALAEGRSRHAHASFDSPGWRCVRGGAISYPVERQCPH